MHPARVLVVESMDAAGSAPADARLRLELLQGIGLDARAVAYAWAPEEPSTVPAAPGADAVPVLRDPAALRAALDRARDRLVLVASAAPGGGPIAGWLPPGVHARWWPTGLHPGGAGAPRHGPPPRPLAALDACAAALGQEPCASSGLSWSVIDHDGGGRRRLSPWDGDYVLVPASTQGRAAVRALRAFARVAAERDVLDLVFLAPRHAELAREARSLGIGARVHFAGAAPRRAEHAWLAAASATLLSCCGPMAGGMTLRALAVGSPLLVVGDGAADRVLARWLEDAGCVVPAAGPASEAVAQALERLLDPDARVREAIERGRSVAALHRGPAVGARVAAALKAEIEARRRAA